MSHLYKYLSCCIIAPAMPGCGHRDPSCSSTPSGKGASVPNQKAGQEVVLKNPHLQEQAEGTYYVDSLIIETGKQSFHSSSSAYLWCWIPLVAVLAIFFIKRRKLQKQISNLNTEKQLTEEKLTERINSMNRKRHQLSNQYITSSHIYKEIIRLITDSKGKICNQALLSASQWEELYATINTAADDFTNRLQEEYSALKTEDIQFCCLMKLELKYAEIACVMGRTPNMMYKRREMVSKRMNLANGQTSLEEYIRKY